MNAYELTEYIINNNKLFEVLEGIGCTNIKNFTKEYRCSTPINTKANSTAIRKNNLKVIIYANDKSAVKDKKDRDNIYTLTMKIKKTNFHSALKEIHKILGLKFVNTYKKEEIKETKDILNVFKKALNKTSRSYYNFDELTIYNEDVCREFINLPYIGWIREGIMPFTQEKFNIGYSREKNRVVIPHRYWCGDKDEYVGVMGRTLNENYDLLDIPKYFPLKKFPKSMNLYGLQENYDGIQKHGFVIVFEAEKSVMKLHSMLCNTGVALCCHELSDEQIKILVSLDVEIIFALDNDMPEQLSIDMCNKIKHLRKTSYIYDRERKWLGEKDSPVDKGIKVFRRLLKNRIRVK